MEKWIVESAFHLRMSIENRSDPQTVGQSTQVLAEALGGCADVRQMSPGAAAIYILSLILTQTTRIKNPSDPQ